MRLRQLLGILLTLGACGAIAAAATSELKNVSVASQGKSTTVRLTATGTFGHNEYRTNDTLFLVDLTGVSAGKLRDSERALQVPGLQSYHVVGYKDMHGADVARLELRVAPGAEVATAQATGGLNVTITALGGAVAATPKEAMKQPASVVAKTPSEVPAKMAASGAIVKIRSVSVVRGKPGIDVEVVGTAPMTAKVLKLTSPDRIVMDIANSLPAQRTPVVAVNSGDVKTIRTGRYQVNPPVTRVVVDLLAAHDYELNAVGNKLVLKLRPAGNARIAAPEPKVESPVSTNTKVAETTKATGPNSVPEKEYKGGSEAGPEAKPVVFVEPKYQIKQQENSDPAPAAGRKPASEFDSNAQVAAVQHSPAGALPESPIQQPAPKSSAAAAQISRDTSKPTYTGEPISVNLKDVDLKDFFRLIHEISGLNVVLDPGVSGTLTLVLDDVPWDQALDIVLKNNSLDRQLEGNVLRIATIDNMRKEAQAKRLQVEAEQLAVPKVSVTRFLSYSHAKDVLPSVKKLLSARGDIIADDRMNALVIQDIPSVIPDIDRLIAQLDRKTREVDIEARVVAATRSFKRDIGTQIGAGWGNGPSAVGGLSSVGESPISGIASAPKYIMGTTNAKSIPLIGSFLPTSPTSGISLINETSSYRVDLILAAAEKRGLLKILSRPHVVTQNNVKAFVKQGMRIPITTQAQLQGPPTVTYVEAVLRLTVTPQITIDNTIFLDVDIENTQADFSNQVQGNPVFLTQQTTTQVLVTDGGTVMIGGVIQTQNSVSTDQIPFLGNVPVLGNLFKHRVVDNSTQELIFIITPKIVQT
jgi:type IV pilus assembly protein PilQ